MRDDQPARAFTWGTVLFLATFGLPAVAGRARATPIGGRLTGQYQHVEQSGRVFYPNGIVRDTSIARSFWSQSYKLHHSATFGQSLNLFSQLDFVDQSYEARPHVSQTATATMRLAHPLFGLSASFRPSVSKVAATSLGNPGDVGTFRPISTHNDQTTFTANFMPPNLPRLDLSWARQRQDAELSDTKRTTTSRNANLVYAVGPLDTHAGIGDQRGDVGTGGARLSDRRHGNAGLGLRLEPLPALTLGMQYDLTAFQTDVPAGPTNHSVSHAGSLSGSLRASQHTGIDLAYSYRTSRQTGGIASRQSSHDGSLLVAYRPNPVASASAGGGFRTLNAERAPVLERYLAGSATAAGRIRTAWTGTASAAHSTLWDRDARARSIESTNLATNLRAGPDFQLGGNFTTSLNSDASVGKGRWSTDGALSVTASPVRKLQLIAGVRSTRAGSSLLGAGTGARSRSIDARWLPAASVDLGGGITQTNPGDRGAGSTTRNARVGLRPGQRLRLSGTYSRSDVATQIAGTSQLRGREVYTAQLGLALARTMSLGANLNLIDPHGANFSRQYDLTLTKDFGR